MPDNDTNEVAEPTVEPADEPVEPVDEPADEPTAEAVDEPVEPVDEPADEPTVETVDDEPAQTEADLVVENPLSDDEQAEQDRQEALAADLAPGQTLPWVAEPPSGVAYERAVEAAGGDEAEDQFPADEDAEGVGSDIPSSRSEETATQLDTQETETEETRST